MAQIAVIKKASDWSTPSIGRVERKPVPMSWDGVALICCRFGLISGFLNKKRVHRGVVGGGNETRFDFNLIICIKMVGRGFEIFV